MTLVFCNIVAIFYMMKKSIHSAVTPKGFQKKTQESSSTPPVSSKKCDAYISKRRLEGIPSVSSSTLTTPATEIIYNSLAKTQNAPHVREKVEYCEDDDHSSIQEESSEEDIEYDEEALRKLLAKKIEQAPAAKVIVSDAMMREALSEINARKSATSTTLKSSNQLITPVISRGESERNTTTAISSISVSAEDAMRHKKTENNSTDAKGHGGDGDAPISNQDSVSNTISPPTDIGNVNASYANFETSEETDSVGCPLEMVLEFLQAVMTKDYKKALVLAKEVEEHEPNNELVLEYMTVLQQIVNKEEEKDYVEGSDSDTNESSSEGVGEYTDELTTSSETDNVSEEEDGESSTESRSSTSTSEESDEEHNHDELAIEDAEGNKEGENVAGKSRENGTSKESLNTSASKDEELQCEDNDEHMNYKQTVEGEVKFYDERSS